MKRSQKLTEWFDLTRGKRTYSQKAYYDMFYRCLDSVLYMEDISEFTAAQAHRATVMMTVWMVLWIVFVCISLII